MCEVILVTLHCRPIRVVVAVVCLFGVAFFRRSLRTRLTAGCT